jgi:SAM-dependent methyltransferase
MSYGRFAYVYDQLMQDVPYDEWAAYIERELNRSGIQQPDILDVACGTGQIAVRLAQKGYEVTGVDLSDDMLLIAREKAEQAGLSISLFQQNMTELEVGKSFDCISIFCDSLNYLQSEQEVQQTFSAVFQHLKQGGLFLFDVHSLYKMNEVFAEGTFVHTGEDVSYIWECFAGEQEDAVEHELTFFVQDETGRYERFEESHEQRTFPVEVYEGWLRAAGFQDIRVTADFSSEAPEQTSERIFFSAVK